MKGRRIVLLSLIIFLVVNLAGQDKNNIPSTLLPLDLMRAIVNEASGDLALQNEIFLTGVNRNRPAAEYQQQYFETEIIVNKLKEYGVDEVKVVEFSSSLFSRSDKTWDAESAELWMVKPEKMKLADLKEIAASLCSGSSSTDVTAELVYVGPGNKEKYYENKDVSGKIVLVNGYPEGARRLAVEKYGALGLVAYASSHPEFDPDQVGWSSIRPTEKEKATFAFMISTRLGQELRDRLERGEKIVLRAVCQTQMVPYKNQLVSALIKGTEFPDEELVFTAHLFEGFAKQGANDDASGCVAILETARVLKKLIADGVIPPLRRSVRFLFIPEISGTAAFVKEHPEVVRRFFANINEDMVGEALIKNNSFFLLKQTPWSLPSYLNDVLAAFIEWVGQTNCQTIEYRRMLLPIISPTGSRDPFYYRIDKFFGSSDHIVFLDGGVKVPAVMLIAWPDMWYHTSGDTPDKSDSTQLKRVVVISVASAVFLANAGEAEVEKMILEVGSRGLKRLAADKRKAEGFLQEASGEGLHKAYKRAFNLLDQAAKRERTALKSIEFFIKQSSELKQLLQTRLKELDQTERLLKAGLEKLYRFKCQTAGLKARRLGLTLEEKRLARLVPVRTEKMKGFFNSWEFRRLRREMKDLPKYNLGRTEFEVRNFIDGQRSILEIRNAVSAEYEPVGLQDVENYMKVLEKLGYIKLVRK